MLKKTNQLTFLKNIIYYKNSNKKNLIKINSLLLKNGIISFK
jgi:hypothetical protein